jgi:hypothetical protein
MILFILAMPRVVENIAIITSLAVSLLSLFVSKRLRMKRIRASSCQSQYDHHQDVCSPSRALLTFSSLAQHASSPSRQQG